MLKGFLAIGLCFFYLSAYGADSTTAASGSTTPAAPNQEPPPPPLNVPSTNLPETLGRAHLMRGHDSLITGLTLLAKEVPINMVKKDDKVRPMVEIPLKYERPGWVLLVQGKYPPVFTGTTDNYKVYAYMNSRINEVTIIAKGPNKKFEKETFYVFAPEAQEFQIVAPWDAVRVALGTTYLLYKESGFNDFYMWSGTVSVLSHSPELSGRWGYFTEADVTALSFASNQSKYAPQILHGHLDGIYFYKWKDNSAWRWQSLLGVDYTTMLSNGSPFGFSNLMAFEIGVRARKIKSEKVDYTYSAFVDPLNASLSQKVLTFEISKSWIFKNSHRGEIGGRYRVLQYEPNGRNVSLSTLLAFFSYSL